MSRSPEIDRLLEGFPTVIEVPIWWGDQDAFGHVNNTIPLRWFESARIAYMGTVGLSRLYKVEKTGPILASITTNYRSQLHYPDTVFVGRVSRIGRSSFTMDHVAVSVAASVIAVDGTSTLVVFNYNAGRSEPLPEAIRHAIEVHEGRAFT